MTPTKLNNLAFTGLVLCVISILAGAVVRGTGSGDGCGASWPTCNGNIVPSSLDSSAIIEYTHRVFSGLLLLVTFLLFIYCKKYSSNRLLQRCSGALLFFVVLEAIIGMVIVLQELVAYNTSLTRLIAVPIHLVNTFSLLALYIVLYSVLRNNIQQIKFIYNKRFLCSCLIFLIVAGLGSITALADLLYPSESFIEGVQMDFSETSQLLTRLRILHPIGASVLLLWMFSESSRLFKEEGILFAKNLNRLSVIVSLVGVLNVFVNINIFLSILHLLFADALWGVYIYCNTDKAYNLKN
ncbi:MAG: COX15/CtaA family protein [Actinomycetota bacterium]|nr:COX15/CtaA family protein [Actinomycetota bacterium]